MSTTYTREPNLALATLAGVVAALAAAVAWGAITAATNYRIGFMAIGVGLLVAFAVRFAGGGHDTRFAYISGALSLLGCVLGNFFAACALIAVQQHADVIGTIMLIAPHIVDFMRETFRPMDLLFYGIGAYFGYKYAMAPLQRQPLQPAQPVQPAAPVPPADPG
jgi:hypothetical protein